MTRFILSMVVSAFWFVLPACSSETATGNGGVGGGAGDASSAGGSAGDASVVNADAGDESRPDDAGGDRGEAGAGGDSGPAPMTQLEGIYALTSWTRNASGCSGEGPSVLEQSSETFVVLSVRTVASQAYLRSRACTGVDDCRALAAGDSMMTGTGGVTRLWTDGTDSEGWKSSSSSAQGDPGQPCDFDVWLYRMTNPSKGTLRFENTRHKVTGIPRDASGKCDHDAAVAAVDSGACISFEVISATFVEGL